MSAGSLRGQVADIGSTLREARMRARIDITEVERATKIRARYLRAIENEEWDALPGPVYVKSFLRTYSDYLGLDSRLLVDEYKRRYERLSDHDLRPVATLRRERERSSRGPLVPPWLLIAVVLVAVVAALFVIGSLFGNGTKTPSIPSKPAATTPPVVHHPRHHPRPRHRPATRATLVIIPTGPVYVCVADATGKLLIPGQIYAPGQTVPTETGRKLLLTLGNNQVTLKVNGKAVPVAPSAGAIGLAVTPTGTAPLTAAQMPRCA